MLMSDTDDDDIKQNREYLCYLCGRERPDFDKIQKILQTCDVKTRSSLLYPPIQSDEENIEDSFPLAIAVNKERKNLDEDLCLIRYLIEEGLRVEDVGNVDSQSIFQFGGLIIAKSQSSPLVMIGLKNKFHILEYIKSLNILEHDHIHSMLSKCIYYDNPTAVIRIINAFPQFLRNDTELNTVAKRIVVHAAIWNSDIELFKQIVEIGILQAPDNPRGIITGEVLQALVSRRYIGCLRYLAKRRPPLLLPNDVTEFELIGYLIVSDGREYRYEDNDVAIFQMLLEIQPTAIRTKVGPEKCLPIHIFCNHIMDSLQDDSMFYELMNLVLSLGLEHRVGDNDNIRGYGGIFESCNGTIPAVKLHRFIKCMGDLDEVGSHSSFLEAAMTCKMEQKWIRKNLMPDILRNMNSTHSITMNVQRRLPIHICLSGFVLEQSCIDPLLGLNSSVLYEIDPVTNLPPPLLAASGYDIDGSNHLSVIYKLIRKCPGLI